MSTAATLLMEYPPDEYVYSGNSNIETKNGDLAKSDSFKHIVILGIHSSSF